MRLLVAFALFVAACGGSKSAKPTTPTEPAPTEPAPPATSERPTDAQIDAMFEDTVVMMEEFGTKLAPHKGDCATIAADINAIIDGHANTLAMARAWKDDADIDARGKAYIEARQDRAKAAAEAFFASVDGCEGDEGVNQALQRLE